MSIAITVIEVKCTMGFWSSFNCGRACNTRGQPRWKPLGHLSVKR